MPTPQHASSDFGVGWRLSVLTGKRSQFKDNPKQQSNPNPTWVITSAPEKKSEDSSWSPIHQTVQIQLHSQPQTSTPFINSILLVSDTTPHSSYHCADPMGLLLQDKWIDPPIQDLWVSGTYKLQLFWFGFIFFSLCETFSFLCFLREADWSSPPPLCL